MKGSQVVGLLIGSAVLMAPPPHAPWHRAPEPRAPVTLEDPLCSRAETLQGLERSRRIFERTQELRAHITFVGKSADGLFEYSTPLGTIWMPQADDAWSLTVVMAEQSLAVYGDAAGFGVRPGDVVIDGGAHVGLYTRAALAAGAGKVIAFEIAPNTVAAFRKNLAAEILAGKVVLVPRGLWHQEDERPLTLAEGCSACNNVMLDGPPSGTAKMTTLDAAMDELGVDRVDVIKLDIENAEANALRGARQTLERHRPRVAVAIDNADDDVREAYANEVRDVIRTAAAGYTHACSASVRLASVPRVLPDVLLFQTE